MFTVKLSAVKTPEGHQVMAVKLVERPAAGDQASRKK